MTGPDITCSKCQRGTLLLVGKAGRRIQVEGASIEVPRGFMIPTCDHCGAEQLDEQWKASLAAAVDSARVATLRSARTDKMGIYVPTSPTSFSIGELVAETYEILGVIGVGGMGMVYEAHDRALNRRVALKVSQSSNPDFSLRQEAQALAAIRHPSMVTVHAFGKHRGIEFLVMELVRGTTLHDHIQEHVAAGKRFAMCEVLDTLVGIAEGLAAVHASGVAHRDIKSANIMLAPGNRTVLMDFGLFTPDLTVDAGAGDLVDLHALCVIAYELLTERKDVPAELAALLVELLAKAPADRPQGIEEVLGRLRAIRARHQERSRAREKFTVLIVDDDRDFAETMRALVRAAVPEADVDVARDGEAALATLKEQTPTVMLLDLNMPRMNGLELCMALRGAGLAASCEIISVNGAASPQDRELLMQLGVRQTVTKTPAISRTIVDLMQTSRRRWLTAVAG